MITKFETNLRWKLSELYFCPKCYLCVVVKERAETRHRSFLDPDNLVRKIRVKQVVGVTGVEPVTLRLSSACSNQLSYTPNKVGGAEESRTPDL